MKMTTDPFEDDLKAYIDGELPWLRSLAVRRHLTRCASCQEEMTTMTQIAEDLRASETEDALPADLRAKILELAPPTPNSGGADPNPAASRLPLPSEGRVAGLPAGIGTPVPPELGAWGRTRPALGWAIAGVALIAWFVLFPTFQKVHEYARRASPASEEKRRMLLKYQQSADESEAARPMAAPGALAAVQTNDYNHLSHFKPLRVGVADGVADTESSDQAATQVARPMAVLRSAPPTPDVNGNSLRQVHKEASIGVQVPNPETTSDTVENMVTESGGYVAANNLSTGDDGMKTAELIVKVPVAQFETFLNQVAKLGNVQSKNITGEDIAEKTSDADQEENVLEDDVQQSETRLKALGSKAKWHDEEATRELRVQLAQSRARLVLLKRMAALGTLTINLSQTPKAVPAPPVTGGFLSSLKGNTHDALQSLMNSTSALLALVIWLLAYAPIWIPLLLIGRYAMRKYTAAQAKAS